MTPNPLRRQSFTAHLSRPELLSLGPGLIQIHSMCGSSGSGLPPDGQTGIGRRQATLGLRHLGHWYFSFRSCKSLVATAIPEVRNHMEDERKLLHSEKRSSSDFEMPLLGGWLRHRSGTGRQERQGSYATPSKSRFATGHSNEASTPAAWPEWCRRSAASP